VQLFDKTNQWKCSDGVTGRIPSFDEIEAGIDASALLSPVETPLPAQNGDALVEDIKQLIQNREMARGNKDFDQADKIRADLQELGVELLDKEKLWKCCSARLQGIITGFRAHELSDVEVTTLVLQREKARMGNDYELSDMIRDELKNRGVTIDDKRKTWSCADGRSGAVPSWGSLTGGGEAAPGAAAQQQPASKPGDRPGWPSLQWRRSWSRWRSQQREIRTPPQELCTPFARPHQVSGPAYTFRATSRVASANRKPEMQQALQLIKRTRDGLMLADHEIEGLVATRERFRMAKDYASSDELRKELQSVGVELLEKEKKWTCTDGRQGAIPLWSNIGMGM
ncbi:cysS, partial [Symbiodinium necroappetens]